MSDVERITTTERHARIPGCLHTTTVTYDHGVEVLVPCILPQDHDDEHIGLDEYLYVAGAKAERVRVVEGLVATIKALRTPMIDQRAEDFNAGLDAAVLAVVEAAREATDG